MSILVQGGTQIIAALDAGYPLLEIWVPEQAAWSVSWWEERTSTRCVADAKRAAVVAGEDRGEVKKRKNVAKLAEAAAAAALDKREPDAPKSKRPRKASEQAGAAVTAEEPEHEAESEHEHEPALGLGPVLVSPPVHAADRGQFIACAQQTMLSISAAYSFRVPSRLSVKQAYSRFFEVGGENELDQLKEERLSCGRAEQSLYRRKHILVLYHKPSLAILSSGTDGVGGSGAGLSGQPKEIFKKPRGAENPPPLETKHVNCWWIRGGEPNSGGAGVALRAPKLNNIARA